MLTSLLLTAAAVSPTNPTHSPFLDSLYTSLCTDPLSLYTLLIIATLSIGFNGFFLLRSQPPNEEGVPPVSGPSASAVPLTQVPPVSSPPSKSSSSAHYPASARMKMVLCVRVDLGMTKGKMCAQCGHAAVGVVDDMQRSKNAKWKEALVHWERKGAMKIAVKAQSEEELNLLQAQAQSLGLPHYLVVDAGHTQIAPNTETVLAIGPAAFEEIDSITGNLKLL